MVSGHGEIKVQTKNFYANLQSTGHYTGADLKTVASHISLPRRDHREIMKGQKTYAEAHAAVRALNATKRLWLFSGTLHTSDQRPWTFSGSFCELRFKK